MGFSYIFDYSAYTLRSFELGTYSAMSAVTDNFPDLIEAVYIMSIPEIGGVTGESAVQSLKPFIYKIGNRHCSLVEHETENIRLFLFQEIY